MIKQIDFNKYYTKICPITCTINGCNIELKQKTWACLLITITEYLIKEKYYQISILNNQPIFGLNVLFKSEKGINDSYHKLSNGKWIDTDYNIKDTLFIVKKLCLFCGINIKNVKIMYEREESKSYHNIINQGSVLTPPELQEIGNNVVVNYIKKIIEKKFSSGLKIDLIELKRFRVNYKDEFNVELLLTDKELSSIIIANTILYKNKHYLINTEIKEHIKQKIEQIITDGIKMIYYSEFFKLYDNELIKGSIIDSGMLRIVIEDLFPEFNFKQTFFTPSITSDATSLLLKKEILRIWGEKTLLSFDEASKLLPFIPIKQIKMTFSRDRFFVRDSQGVYSHLGKVIITENEKKNIFTYVTNAIKAKRYVALNELPLDNLKTNNYELSDIALQVAIFEIVLENNYSRNGKIISYSSDNVTTKSIMKEYCRNQDRCSLQELIELEIELTCKTHYTLAMESGYSEMVRVENDLFIAEKFLHFDFENIDKAIDYFIKGQYLPLQAHTVFATFPDCNYPWNLFLLESYCRRFSKRFRFDVLAYNSMNVGVIVRKECNLSYHEIMIDAINKSNIKLEEVEVINFLYDNGYIGRRTYSKVDDLINKVKLIN